MKASIREKGTTSNGYLNGVACVNKYKRRDSLNNMQFCIQPIQGGGLLVRAKIKLKQNKFLDRKNSGAHISHIANHGFLRSSFLCRIMELTLVVGKGQVNYITAITQLSFWQRSLELYEAHDHTGVIASCSLNQQSTTVFKSKSTYHFQKC